MNLDLLKAQNDKTSNAFIEHFSSTSDVFEPLSKKQLDLTVNRDQEDADKLQVGVEQAQADGVLPKNPEVSQKIMIDVQGKSADQVAEEIMAKGGLTSESNGIMVLMGLSGTGKGTTVATMKKKIPKAVTWSNGNIFRSITYLAHEYGAVNNTDFGEACKEGKADAVLTKERLDEFMKCLEFKKDANGEWDTFITATFGEKQISMTVREKQNTDLKAARIQQTIASVAQLTQGHVVKFASDAAQQMMGDGAMVLVEGREQTLNFMETKLRFELTLSDLNIIGRRQAACKIAGNTLKADLGDIEKLSAEEQAAKIWEVATEQLTSLAKAEGVL